jgi:hypothetical protein
LEAKVVPVTREYATMIADNMRDEDVREIWASHHERPHEAMEHLIHEEAYVWLVDGKPLCLFGVKTLDLLTNTGSPWMLGSKELTQFPMRFLRGSLPVVKSWMKAYDTLYNYVHAENTLSIKWLRWLGFHLDEAAPHGIDAENFHRFEWRAYV